MMRQNGRRDQARQRNKARHPKRADKEQAPALPLESARGEESWQASISTTLYCSSLPHYAVLQLTAPQHTAPLLSCTPHWTPPYCTTPHCITLSHPSSTLSHACPGAKQSQIGIGLLDRGLQLGDLTQVVRRRGRGRIMGRFS